MPTQIIPIPKSVEITNSYFILSDDTGITSNANFQTSYNFLKEYITFPHEPLRYKRVIRFKKVIKKKGYKK